MKRIYFLFLSMLISMASMIANAQSTYTLTVNVDDATRVGVQTYSNESYTFVDQEVVDGANTYTVASYSQIRIYAKEGNLLASVYNDTYNYNVQSSYSTEYSTYVSSDLAFTVTSAKESDVYTKTFKITVDNPSATMVRLYSGRVVSLTQGENVVAYSPETEPQLSISSSSGTPLYKVTDNGTEVKPQNNT